MSICDAGGDSSFYIIMKAKEKRKGKTAGRAGKIMQRTLTVLACLLLALLLAGTGAVAWTAAHLDDEADMEVMEAMRGSRTSRLYAPDGKVPRASLTLDNYRPVETDILFGDENMVWAQSEELPDTLKHAFIAIEDQRFYSHRGVDWRRTGLAALNYVFHFRDTFGGSTITQQLIKNVHGEKDVSATRKLKEIIRAGRLEKEYSKDEILTYYLNIVPLGHRCVGVKSAARYYFGKALSELTDEECAALAAITNAPARYEPVGHMRENDSRRALVLRAMYENGYLTSAAYECAAATPLTLNVTDPVYTRAGHNWYTETVIEDVIRDLSAQMGISEAAASAMLYRGGLEIYTLMDPDIQKVLDEYFSDLSHFPEYDGKQINGGMIVSDPATGDLLGIAGGVGEKEGARLFNRATGGYYPPGSSLKPLALYGPAIEKNLITYATVFDDVPSETEKGLWPHNSPNVYAGYMPVHEALARSKNTVAVKLLNLLGKESVYRHLEDNLHFSGMVNGARGELSDKAAAPLALGQLSHGVTMREMNAAFGSFANGGRYEKPRTYLAVYDAKGELLLRNERAENRVWSEQTAYIMTKMMSEVVDWGTAHRLTIKETVDTAGKTGTSGGDKDKWFVGYTPYYVASFRCGIDDGTALPAGTVAHLTVWDEVMKAVHRVKLAPGEDVRGFEMPEGIVTAEYCRDSGMVPTEACRKELRGSRTEIGIFKAGTVPYETCNRHVEGHFDLCAEEYGRGTGDPMTAVPFYVLSVPDRRVPGGVYPTDGEYTLEHLMQSHADEGAEEEDRTENPAAPSE